MPASSVSGALSTSVYFVSLFLLLGVLVPPVRTVYQDADLSAARHLAEGIAAQIDNLSPGMTSILRFDSFPGVSTSVALSGASVTVAVDGSSVSQRVTWQLPDTALSADREYVVTLDGGELEIA